MDKKISQLTGATTPLTGTEELAIVQGGSTVKATAQDVADLAGAPYLVYSATLTQSGTNAPVATVLQNTIGSMVWSYGAFAPGAYEVVGTLPLGKSVVIAGPPNTFGPFSNVVLGTFSQVLANKIIIKSTNSSGTMQDGLLNNHFIEIRVYP